MSLESESLKHGVDVASAVVTIATIAQWLPSVAALLTVIWTLIRIYETKTVRRLMGRDPGSGSGARDDSN
jgi:hypothetical protein